jgi:hypothetical protein
MAGSFEMDKEGEKMKKGKFTDILFGKKPKPPETLVGAELVKWAKTENNLAHEIIVVHDVIFASGHPGSDFEERWWIESKKVGKNPGRFKE